MRKWLEVIEKVTSDDGNNNYEKNYVMCPNCQTQYPEYAREYNYCPNCGVNLTESMFDELKRELWMNGTEAIDDFFGYEYDVEEDKDVTENRMTEIMLQMPPEEFMKYYNKYCARKDNENIC